MYKIPENFDISEIIDQVVFQVAFGLNFISLSFNKGFIQFSGSYSFKYVGGSISQVEVFPVKSDSGLLIILEKKIIDVEINNERDHLTIDFENESTLSVFGNKLYESFKIRINDIEIIV